MRSVRMLLATATATAALAITPAAYAITAGDWDQEDTSSHSKEHDKDSSKEHDKDSSKEHDKDSSKEHDKEYSKEHGKESKHDGPRGGVHTGGGALAALISGDEWDTKDPKHDKEGKHEEESKHEEGKHEKGGKHDGPRGGIHTGGGALALLNNGDDWGSAKDPKHDPDSYRNKDDGSGKDSWGGDHGKDSWKDDHGKDSWDGDHGKDSWGDDHDKDSWGGGGHDKPHGGMHTGGGGLDTPGVTAGGLAALAVAGTGVYALRRRKASGTVA